VDPYLTVTTAAGAAALGAHRADSGEPGLVGASPPCGLGPRAPPCIPSTATRFPREDALTGERARSGAAAFSSRPLWAVNSLVLFVLRG
jgi:hypothetical protein